MRSWSRRFAMWVACLAGPVWLAACGGGSGNGDEAAVGVTPERLTAAVAHLDTMVPQLMARSGVPGMSVVVVHEGRRLYAKGFGVRRLGQDDPVDADTVFQIASLSKPVGATVVATQVSAGRVDWHTPVVSLLPWFQMSDPQTTRDVTIGHFYSHTSGMADHAGDQLEDIGYSRRELQERLRYLPLTPLGKVNAYTNAGLTLGADAVAAAAGESWEDLSERTLYQPLGMTRTSSRYADFVGRDNRALGHMLVDGRYRYVPGQERMPDAQSPAGGVSSSANDMGKWMALVLAEGMSGSKRIYRAEAMAPALRPQPTPAFTYGYGFNVNGEGVTFQASHSGGFLLGAGTSFRLLPSAQLGIVVLSNGAPSGAPEAIAAEFMDLALYGKSTYPDWYQRYHDHMQGMFKLLGEYAGQTPPAAAVPGDADPRGRYHNPYYGDAVVEDDGAGGLVFRLGPGLKVDHALRHWDGNQYVFALGGENAPVGSLSWIRFEGAAGGAAQRLQVEYYNEVDGGVFVRVPNRQ